jgi:hypothetical protein
VFTINGNACFTSLAMKQQLGRDAFISVFKDPVYGWNAKIFAPPSKVSGLQAILDEIVRVLRSQHDLEE